MWTYFVTREISCFVNIFGIVITVHNFHVDFHVFSKIVNYVNYEIKTLNITMKFTITFHRTMEFKTKIINSTYSFIVKVCF